PLVVGRQREEARPARAEDVAVAVLEVAPLEVPGHSRAPLSCGGDDAPPAGSRQARSYNPRTERARRLHRPLPLPGAVLAPLPARAAGALQGLAARRGVVAREPARADGHLRARLLDALAREHGRPLRALPALRARGLDLLRDLGRLGRAEHGRQLRADQEGALPAAAGRVLGGGDAARHLRRDARRALRPEPRAAAADARHDLARDPARGPNRRACGRARARGRIGERRLPRRRAPRGRAPPAVVLPDADPLPVRAVPPPDADGLPALRELRDAPGLGAPRSAVLRPDAAAGRRRLPARRRRGLARARRLRLQPRRRPDRRGAVIRTRPS